MRLKNLKIFENSFKRINYCYYYIIIVILLLFEYLNGMVSLFFLFTFFLFGCSRGHLFQIFKRFIFSANTFFLSTICRFEKYFKQTQIIQTVQI